MAISRNRMILNGVDTTGGPIFTVSEVAKVFFARTSHWIRWKERGGAFKLDGKDVGGFRAHGDKDGARRYTLSDVEKMVHALASRGDIDGHQMAHALMTVKAVADVHGLLGPDL